MTIDNLFDVTKDNVHLVKIDSFEAAIPVVQESNIIKASDKQLAFLKSLFAERTGNAEAMFIREHLLDEYRKGTLSIRMASIAIEEVKAIPRDQQTFSTHDEDISIEHGQVWVSNNRDFVKVQLNQTATAFYGKVWNSETMEWDYAGKTILHHLHHIITPEEAKEFSRQWDAEHHTCIFCMRHLSDPRSEFAGYGETCAENNNLPWGEVA